MRLVLPSAVMGDEVEVPAGHYRDAKTGEIKPKQPYVPPRVEDLGAVGDVTQGNNLGGDDTGSISVT